MAAWTISSQPSQTPPATVKYNAYLQAEGKSENYSSSVGIVSRRAMIQENPHLTPKYQRP